VHHQSMKYLSTVKSNLNNTLRKTYSLTGILTIGIFVLLFGLIRLLMLTDGRLALPLDDSWIHFQYARNIVNGDGFSYNPGVNTPGSTAPLWTLLLTLPAAVSNNLLPFGMLLSAGFYLLSAALIWQLTLFFSDGDKRAAFLAALGYVLAGRMLWAGLSGMEVTAFTAVSLAAILSYSKNGLRIDSALLFGLASQLRPEGHLLFVLVGLDAFIKIWFGELGTIDNSLEGAVNPFLQTTRLFIPAGIYIALSLPYVLFSLSVTGKPLPNTFYAKAGDGFAFRPEIFWATLKYHWADNYAAGLLAIPGLIWLWRKSRPAAVWLVSLIVLFPFLVGFVWHFGRYTMPLVAFQMVAAGLFASWLINLLPENFQRWGLAFFVAVILGSGIWELPTWGTLLGQNSKEILDIDHGLAEWIMTNTPENAVIAVDDIGVIGYRGERTLFDMNGLISPEAWAVRDDPNPQARMVRLLADAGATHFAGFPGWHAGLAENYHFGARSTTFKTETGTIIGAKEAYIINLDLPYLPDGVRQPDIERPVLLGQNIALIGLNDVTLSDNQLELTLYWRSVQEIDNDWTVFVHLIDRDGNVVAQNDHFPGGGLAPTSYWRVNDLVRDTVVLAIPGDLSAGAYSLRTGMYLVESLERLPAVGENVTDNSIFLQEINWR
jgi:arabinofuranosyltransferase